MDIGEMKMSEALEKVRKFEENERQSIDFSKRPVYHVTGLKGWINDPNGFSYYNEEVHLFYQAHPYKTDHGPMHWGHAKTDDFIKWTYLPSAMAPDEKYDRNGCFSGTALTMPDGRHLLMYTGVDEKGDSPETRRQTQCIAIGDGIDYEKIKENPVIDSSVLPAGSSDIDFRDPKIWAEDGRYYCIAVNRVADGSGAVLLFSSEDALHWNYGGMLAKSEYAYGDMWECPDLFEMDGCDVLALSVQGMGEHALLAPGYISFAMIGEYDRLQPAFISENVQMLDEGIDFYAPQTLLMPDGRRIMIGWMQNWDTISEKHENLDFNGQMSVPRELSIRDGRIYQRPVREFDNYRKERTHYEGLLVDGDFEADGIIGRVLDLNLTIKQTEAGYEHFYIYLAEKKHIYTRIDVNANASMIRVNRTCSRKEPGTINERSFRYTDEGGNLKLRILLDRYSMEIFVQDGAQAATFLIYSEQDADGIHFSADGEALLDIDQYTIDLN